MTKNHPIQRERVATFAVILAILAGTVITVWIVLSPEEKSLLLKILNEHPALILTAAFLFPLAVVLAANWVFRHYIEPLRTLVDEVKVMNLVNPSHRLAPGISKHVNELSTGINRALDRIQELQANVDDEIQHARRTLEEEKIILETLIQDLPDGVIVCNLDGQILLYNRQARDKLTPQGRGVASLDGWYPAGTGEGKAGGAEEPDIVQYLGLGRSVFGFFNRDLIVHSLDILDGNLREVGERKSTRFVTTGGDGRLLGVETRLLLDPNREMHGYVLLMRDISGPMERDDRRDALPASSDAKGDSPARHEPMTLKSRPEFYDFDLFGSPAANLPPGKRPLPEIIYTAFDTETTGLRPSEGDEIISIGAVRIVNGRILSGERFEQLIDPRRHITIESTRIHGLDDAMLTGQPVIEKVLSAFFQFAHDTVLVGHNAAFDMRFFQIKENRTGVKFGMPVLDTLLLSAVAHPHHDDHSMEGIAGRLGVNLAGRHTALGDAIVTGELFLKLIPLLAGKGIRTLEQATEASKKAYLARVKY